MARPSGLTVPNAKRGRCGTPLPFDSLRAGFDRALRTVKEYHEKVDYIHLNPVKAGLVRQPEDWPWSSIHDYNCGVKQAPPIPTGLSMDRFLLPADEREYDNGDTRRVSKAGALRYLLLEMANACLDLLSGAKDDRARVDRN
jgi:hypothetical protein